MSSEQMQLDLSPIVTPDYAEHLTLQQRFEAFDAANPHVMVALESLARDWFNAGHSCLGISMLFETLRWQAGIQTRGDAYRLNNDFRSRYARRLIEANPEWTDRIKTRVLKAA